MDVNDFGDHYLITIKGKGQAREFIDESRDCEARARAAAVFVALILAPSPEHAAETARERAGAPTPDPMQPSSPSSSPWSSPSSLPYWGAWLSIGGMGATAYRTDNSQVIAGGDIRFIFAAQSWGFSLGGALSTPSTFQLASVRVHEARYPFDIGIRRLWTTTWIAGAFDLGALGALCQLQQEDQPNASTASHIELGVRAAATLSTAGPRLGLYMSAFSEFIPVTRRIAVEPQGIIGRTAAFWMGAAVGVTARFH